MATFLTDLMNSIFVAGPTQSLIVATNASFAALQFVLFCLLIATYSIHFLILSFLSAGLWWSINWFVAELTEARRQEEERKAKDKGIVSTNEDDSDTEQEAAIPVGGGAAGSHEVEVLEKVGEIRDRGAGKFDGATSGSGTEHSTEDEWEKVSGNENEKDK